MSQNPFESLGAGGFDMNALLQQAQQLQEQLASAQDRLAETTVEGEVGGGTVKVTLTGTGELRAVTIKQGVVDGSDDESLEELGDLIVAAYRDAKAKADELVGEQMNPFGDLGGGADQPGQSGDQSGGQSGGGNPTGFGLPPGPSNG